MSNNDEWQEIEQAPTWKPENETEIEGVYLSKEEQVGPNKSNFYSIEKTNGVVIGIWGNAVIDNRFKSIKIGNLVKIVFLGKVKNERTGRLYNNFKVYSKGTQSE